MIPILFKNYTLDDIFYVTSTNGDGPLDVISATVSEELNGAYTAELQVPFTGRNGNNVNVGDFILLSVPVFDLGGQDIFRVSKIRKSMNQVLTVYAEHVSYALNYVGVKPFEMVYSLPGAIIKIRENLITPTPFEISGSTDDPFGFELTHPATVREVIGGLSENLISRYRCEVQWFMNSVFLYDERGTDRGYYIDYGVNMIDFNQEANINKMVDGISAYAHNDVNYYYYVNHYFSPNPVNYPKMAVVDVQDDIDMAQPVGPQIDLAIGLYISRHNVTEPEVNIALDFVHLGDTDQYKNLDMQKVSLGDTITVNFPLLDIKGVKSKMVSYKWDCLDERYLGIQIGTPKQQIEESVAQYVNRR